MRHGKNPTLAQKKRIEKYKLKAKNWLVIKDCREMFLIKHRLSGKVKAFKV